MASNVTNRETARDHLYDLLSTALVGTGKPCQAGYNYKKADFQGQSPVFVLSSSGRHMTLATTATRAKSDIYLDLFLFALWAETGTAYQEDDAEDTLDAAEKAAIDVLIDNICLPAYWHDIEMVDRSYTAIENVGGDTYKVEMIPLRLKVLDN